MSEQDNETIETEAAPELPPLPPHFRMPDGWEASLTRLFETGCTNEEVIAWIVRNRPGKFTQNMFYQWYRNIPQFKEVVDRGTIYKKAWWLERGRVGILDSKFNTPLYIRMMANLFGWRTESSEIESVGERVDLTKLSKEELELYRKLRDKMKKEGSNGVVKQPANGEDHSKKQLVSPAFAGHGRD